MRKLLAIALMIVTSSAQAAPIAGAGAMQAAAQAGAPLQTVACARYGWRGWGIYPGCFRGPIYAYAPPYAVAEPYYTPAPVYVAPPRRCWIAGAWQAC